METEVVAREPISFCGALSQQWLLASVRPTSAGWPAQFQSVHQDQSVLHRLLNTIPGIEETKRNRTKAHMHQINRTLNKQTRARQQLRWATVWPQQTRAENGPKVGGCASRRWELGPHLTQCRLSRGLSPYQVASCGHNRHGPKIGGGCAPFLVGSWVPI